jgi:hypothetical protein
VDVSSDTTTTTVYEFNLERDPSQCIGLLEKPGCGVKPADAGERGGGLQLATFGIIIAGLAVVMTVIFRNVLRADKRKAAEVADPETRWKK